MKTNDPASQAIERVRLELVARKFMVMILALVAVWVGIAMMLTGAPSFLEGWFSPWSRYAVGSIAFMTGLLTSIGGSMTDQKPGGWWTQVVGLTGLCAWYAGMGIAYIGLVISEGFTWAGLGEALDPSSSGRAYVPIVYLGLMIMTATPLVTMLRLGRPRR